MSILLGNEEIQVGMVVSRSVKKKSGSNADGKCACCGGICARAI